MRKTTAAKSSVTAAHLRRSSSLPVKYGRKQQKKIYLPHHRKNSTPVSQNRLNPTLRNRLTIMQKGSMLVCVEDINTTTRKTTCYLIYTNMGRLSGCEACTPWKANMLINLVAFEKKATKKPIDTNIPLSSRKHSSLSFAFFLNSLSLKRTLIGMLSHRPQASRFIAWCVIVWSKPQSQEGE